MLQVGLSGWNQMVFMEFQRISKNFKEFQRISIFAKTSGLYGEFGNCSRIFFIDSLEVSLL